MDYVLWNEKLSNYLKKIKNINLYLEKLLFSRIEGSGCIHLFSFKIKIDSDKIILPNVKALLVWEE